MRVSFHHLAERELNEAARYYELRSPRLGAAFLGEVERSAKPSFSTRKLASGFLDR